MLAQIAVVLLIQTASAAIVGGASLKDAGAPVVDDLGRTQQAFLDFPVVLFGADGEFEVFLGDRVPVLQSRPG